MFYVFVRHNHLPQHFWKRILILILCNCWFIDTQIHHFSFGSNSIVSYLIPHTSHTFHSVLVMTTQLSDKAKHSLYQLFGEKNNSPSASSVSAPTDQSSRVFTNTLVEIRNPEPAEPRPRQYNAQDYVRSLNTYYASVNPKMLHFVELWLKQHPYDQFCQQYQTDWYSKHPGTHGSIWVRIILINKFVNTTMEWPQQQQQQQDSLPNIRVKELPQHDQDVLIDLLGAELSMPRGVGNYALFDIYQKYKDLCNLDYSPELLLTKSETETKRQHVLTLTEESNILK